MCKPRHDGSDASELNYVLIMEAEKERDTGKFDSLELNIDSILSFDLHYRVLLVSYLQKDITRLELVDFEK